MISDESLRNLVALGERVPAALAHAQATGEWEIYNAAGVKARTAWADEAVDAALAAELLALRALVREVAKEPCRTPAGQAFATIHRGWSCFDLAQPDEYCCLPCRARRLAGPEAGEVRECGRD